MRAQIQLQNNYINVVLETFGRCKPSSARALSISIWQQDVRARYSKKVSTFAKRAGQDQSGATAFIFSIAIFLVLGAAATAITSGDMFRVRSKTQAALDSAVLAGASAPFNLTDDERIVVAKLAYNANMTARAIGNANLAVVPEPGATFTVTSRAVEGVVNFTMTSPFLSALRHENVEMKVSSAARRAFGAPVCVLGLDPTEDATIDFNGHARLQVDNCATQANSSSSSGLNQVGSPSMTALEIGVTGGFAGTGYTPPPVNGTQPFPDPFASLPAPAPGPCHAMSGQRLQQTTTTLTPGTYCGGLTIKASSVVTLSPGEYIFLDGPLSIDSQAQVRGTEVLLAFLGPTSTMYLYSGAILNVTSPVSGTYKNIQFFGDRTSYSGPGANGVFGSNLWFTVIGDSQLTYDGALYAPTFHVWFAGGSIVEAKSPNYIAVAKKLWFQDNTQVHFSQENTRGMTVEASGSLRYGATMYR